MFSMLLGFDDVKPDTWLIRFVGEALGKPTTYNDVSTLLIWASKTLSVSALDLDHAIWAYMST